ncbi:MAG TPA: tripartite tricarboxylate transporter substrate-binding protein [Candidatus Binatia bacterium]|jgi:tripartite-type tricarboxylate transporter receptor subunit TctC|nr:tripartite tricarboxylate transporter substrate-binding protein [Candidatus Binatia bacterium]
MKSFVIGFLFLIFGAANLEAQAPFYEGKTIRIIVGLPAGDVYDLYARMLAEHMGKHIPGNPNIIVQNMAGASSMITANYVYNVAKPDGLTFGSILPSLYFDQLVGRSEVKFDWPKFTWLGSFEKSNNLLYMRSDTPFKTIHDVTKTNESPKCGSTGTGSPSYYLVKLMNESIGAKFEIVTGYKGGQEIDLAVEKGEVDCRAFTVTTYFAREPFISWRKKNFVRVLFQTGKTRDPRLPEVPTVQELIEQYKTPEGTKRMAALVLASGEFGRPIIATPGIPADRVKMLREAFSKTLSDPALLADAKKRRLDIDPTSAEDLESLAKEVFTANRELIDRMKTLLSK